MCNASNDNGLYITYMQLIDIKNATLLGQRIKTFRKEKNLSLNKISMVYSDLTSATWSRIENAKNEVKFSSLLRVAAALDVSIVDLLKDIDFDYSFEED